MPAIPPGLREWLALLTQPAVILVGVGLIVNQQNKRIDDLREDVKELRAEHRADNKALNEKVDDLRDEVKGLPLKIDARVIFWRLTVMGKEAFPQPLKQLPPRI